MTTSSTGGTPPYQFAWSNAASVPNLTNLAAGPYTLTLTDAKACTRLLPVQVPAFGKIPLLTPFTELITCAHPSALIGVSANQNDLNYKWLSPGGPLANQPSQLVVAGGLYQVTATNSFGCQASLPILVLENKTSPLAEAGAASIKVPCTETKILLNAVGSSQGGNFVNRWSGLRNGAWVLDTVAVVIPIYEPGLYVHTVQDLTNGCITKDSIQVDWDEPIKASFSVDSIQCFGDDDGAIHILNVSGGRPPFYYSIDNLNFTTKNTFAGLSPGHYPLRVRDDYGCWWENSTVLTQPDSLSVRLTASDTSIELGRYVNLIAIPLPKGKAWSNMIWGPADQAFAPMSLRQKVKPEKSTEFSVQLVDKNGCIAEDRLRVAVHNYHIYAPNVIYPGKGLNGQFTIFAGDGVSEIRLMRIFSRWGELLFERRNFAPNDPAAGWDGLFRGQPLSPGVFAWYAEVALQDGRVLQLKGDVTILR